MKSSLSGEIYINADFYLDMLKVPTSPGFVRFVKAPDMDFLSLDSLPCNK